MAFYIKERLQILNLDFKREKNQTPQFLYEWKDPNLDFIGTHDQAANVTLFTTMFWYNINS